MNKTYRVMQNQLWIGPSFLSLEAAYEWAMFNLSGFFAIKSY